MDLSWLPDWLCALIRDPVMPLSLALMTYIWFRGLGTSFSFGVLLQNRLNALITEITQIGQASIPDRRRWLLDGGMTAAFKTAGLEGQGRILRTTSTGLESGDSAVLLSEVKALYDVTEGDLTLQT